MKTPSYYRAPLTKRAAIIAWLLARPNSRPSYGLFTFNVKIYNVDLSFDNLAKQDVGVPDQSARYLAECRKRHNENELYDMAIEDMRDSINDTDSYRMLWDGEANQIAEWTFDGRSGGWLVLKSFDDKDLENLARDYDLADILEDASYVWLRRLYRFLVQCDHDFRREALVCELVYQAAFNFFHNVCSDVLTDAQAADQMACLI